MSKATYTGRLKSIDKIMRLEVECHPTVITGTYIQRLIHLIDKGGNLELQYNEKRGYCHYGSYTFNEHYFTDLKPIKPKKQMRPYTDEEWKDWFLNDRIVIDNRDADNEDYTDIIYLMIHGLTPTDEDQFYYMGEGEWLSKDSFLNEFLDRHGNKFEKEV